MKNHNLKSFIELVKVRRLPMHQDNKVIKEYNKR
jgi:hypothetical protein